MKGTLGMYLLFYIISVAGAANIKTPPEAGKVVVFGEAAQQLLSCEVEGTFTNFTWKKGTEELCKAGTEADSCTIRGAAAELYETKDPKYNLHVKTNKAVTFDHAASYTCELTAYSEYENKTGDITVVASRLVCPPEDVIRPKDIKSTITCQIDYKGTQPPTLTISGNKAELTDRDADENGVITRVATLEITPTADTLYECRYNEAITCTIFVKTFPSKVATRPESVTWAKVNTAATIPCTMHPNQTYIQVAWYRLDGTGTLVKICYGSASAAGTCPTKGYSLDDTKKHDLAIKKATTANLLKYSCKVEATDDVENEIYPTQLAGVKDPVCHQTMQTDGKLTLSCTVELRGSNEKPTMKWFDGTTEVKSEMGTVPKGADWKKVTLTAPLEKKANKYVCQIFSDTTGTTKIANCTYSSKVATHPESVTWAKVNTAATIPCTMKPAQTYIQVNWYTWDFRGKLTKVCYGSALAAGTCPTKGYYLDDTKKHDLTMSIYKTTERLKYRCTVETTDNVEDEIYLTQVANVKDPVCQAMKKGDKLTLNCTVELKGTDAKPTMKWFDGKTEVLSEMGTVPKGADWKKVTLTAPLANETNNYVCQIFSDTTGTTEIANCSPEESSNSAASALSAKFLQSTLLSLIVVFVMNQFE